MLFRSPLLNRSQSCGPHVGFWRAEIESAPDPQAERKRIADDYRLKFNNPYRAASTGYVDDIIEPRESRPKIIAALSALRDKYAPAPPRKHGNIPV